MIGRVRRDRAQSRRPLPPPSRRPGSPPRCGGCPRSSSRLPSAPTATTVPMVSKKSASSSEKTSSTSGRNRCRSNPPENAGPNAPKTLTSPDQMLRSGSGDDAVELRHVERPAGGVLVGHLRPDVGNRLDDHRDHCGRRDRDQHRALHLLGPQDRDQEEPDHEDQHRPAGQGAADAELDRRRTGRFADDAAVEQSDEGDEQPDADGDTDPQRAGHCPEDRLPEAGEDQHGDQQPLDHDQAHRLWPGHLRRDAEGQQGIQPETGGDPDREPADHPHQDGHHPGHQRGGRRDQGDRVVDVGADHGAGRRPCTAPRRAGCPGRPARCR